MVNEKALLGIVLGGRRDVLEKIVSNLEQRADVKLYYVARANPNSFLVIVKAKKKGREVEASKHR